MTDPTPSEIAAMCQAIQASWSDEERLQRLDVFDRQPDYVPRVVSTVGLGEEEEPGSGWLELHG